MSMRPIRLLKSELWEENQNLRPSFSVKMTDDLTMVFTSDYGNLWTLEARVVKRNAIVGSVALPSNVANIVSYHGSDVGTSFGYHTPAKEAQVVGSEYRVLVMGSMWHDPVLYGYVPWRLYVLRFSRNGDAFTYLGRIVTDPVTLPLGLTNPVPQTDLLITSSGYAAYEPYVQYLRRGGVTLVNKIGGVFAGSDSPGGAFTLNVTETSSAYRYWRYLISMPGTLAPLSSDVLGNYFAPVTGQVINGTWPTPTIATDVVDIYAPPAPIKIGPNRWALVRGDTGVAALGLLTWSSGGGYQVERPVEVDPTAFLIPGKPKRTDPPWDILQVGFSYSWESGSVHVTGDRLLLMGSLYYYSGDIATEYPYAPEYINHNFYVTVERTGTSVWSILDICFDTEWEMSEYEP
jgi:hypothetical protein